MRGLPQDIFSPSPSAYPSFQLLFKCVLIHTIPATHAHAHTCIPSKAYRHNGFIPHDDDVDLEVRPSDLPKIRECVREANDSGLCTLRTWVRGCMLNPTPRSNSNTAEYTCCCCCSLYIYYWYHVRDSRKVEVLYTHPPTHPHTHTHPHTYLPLPRPTLLREDAKPS